MRSIVPLLWIDRNQSSHDKMRLVMISVSTVVVAAVVSLVGRLLVFSIDFFTNLSFYGKLSLAHGNPEFNQLGIIVIIIPVFGGIIVGLMERYGSRAISGHGIPEAMEQVLTNQSKIKPSLAILKPLSAAISIGTGYPFGAEGPIIATGSALGSTIGQLLRITDYERKIFLAAGAAAGMAAIFGSPLAAIFLAIEFLLFEFSPWSIIPIALASITGAAGHYLLFSTGPVFPVGNPIGHTSSPDLELLLYSMIGIFIGLFSVVATKSVYRVEDFFEKLPLHWAWWPAVGGIAVGVIGYFAPRTFGVGYDNIKGLLSNQLSLNIILSLCVLKFISWAIALGSGTSGGTLAPLLTVGGATGALLAFGFNYFFPNAGVFLPFAALVGMSAMFAGATRAVFTSIIFGLETTGQGQALLPLIATCTASYFVSFFIMKNTLMTEKISRRGIKTPHIYESDILERISVKQVINKNSLTFSEDTTIQAVREKLTEVPAAEEQHLLITTKNGEIKGALSSSFAFSFLQDPNDRLGNLIKQDFVSIGADETLKAAAETMARNKTYMLIAISNENSIIGVVSHKDIMDTIHANHNEHLNKQRNLTMHWHTLFH